MKKEICFALVSVFITFSTVSVSTNATEFPDKGTEYKVCKQNLNKQGNMVMEKYKILNNQETRYQDYKDSDSLLEAKLLQVDYINKNRAKYGASPVELDILASRVANRMCKESCENNFMGHWNMRGEKPYHRYAFAGGLDHIAENASAKWSSASFPDNINTYKEFMMEAHDSFMDEVAPNDGHKQNCIEKDHNYVGLGCYLFKGQFRYYEEFLDRYIDFLDVKTETKVNNEIIIKVKPLSEKQNVYIVTTGYEDFPKPLTPDEINSRGGYPDYTEEEGPSYWPWNLEKMVTDNNTYSIPFKFNKAGLYYVQIYLSNEKYKGGTAATNGKIQGSGLVISVKN